MNWHVPTLIEAKRDGRELTAAELEALIDGYVAGHVPDEQMSALAMAIYFQGMTAAETATLTRIMRDSGEVFRHPPGPAVVDKHSTGGIGDKVSLVLAPLVAAAGQRIPMVSGRGLGITGGTLDKLESIPGFRTRLDLAEAQSQLARLGVVMMGQTEDFCPADRRLYALRDVTGTVPSIPLITASIMSKKLAESLDRLVLDVKFGSGAFMKTRAAATDLAAAMEAVGHEMGVAVHTVLSPMSEPLGRSVGNALEVSEALDCLAGEGPDDLRELVLDLACPLVDLDRAQLARLLDQGAARQKFDQLVEAQGGQVRSLDDFARQHPAPVVDELRADRPGRVRAVDAGQVGHAALLLGAGRATQASPIDPAVGFDQLVKVGETVEPGQLLSRIHAATPAAARQASAQLRDAIQLEP